MHPILACLIGVALTLLCGGASLWLAKALWKSRTDSLTEEILMLRSTMREMKSMDALREQVAAMRVEIVNSRKPLTELTETVDKLDTSIFKLVQVQTGALTLSPGAVDPWGRNKQAQTDPSMSELQSTLPQELGQPT